MDQKTVKLFDSELKVMDILWKEGDVPAKHVAEVLTGELGWNKNTTYTLIKRCIKKGAIERFEPSTYSRVSSVMRLFQKRKCRRPKRMN